MGSEIKTIVRISGLTTLSKGVKEVNKDLIALTKTSATTKQIFASLAKSMDLQNQLLSVMAADLRRARITTDKLGKSVRTLDRRVKPAGRGIRKLGTSTRTTTKAMVVGSTAGAAYSANLRNIGSSAIFALGPLSGIGARVQAFTAVMGRSGIVMASFAAGFGFAAVGIFKLGKAIVTTELELTRIRNTLKAVTSSNREAKAEFAFVTKEAKRLGLDLTETAKQYAKLVASAKGTTLEGAATREIFTRVAEASTILGLSVEDTTGVFRALQQMMSKGTIQAEELRGQLGDRLPGAVGILARSLNVTTGELNKLLDKGEVLADKSTLLGFVREMTKTFGDATEAAKALPAQLGRVSTAATEFFDAIDSRLGVATTFGKIIGGWTFILNEFADAIKVTDTEKLEEIFKAIETARAGGRIQQLGTAIRGGVTNFALEIEKQDVADFGRGLNEFATRQFMVLSDTIDFILGGVPSRVGRALDQALGITPGDPISPLQRAEAARRAQFKEMDLGGFFQAGPVSVAPTQTPAFQALPFLDITRKPLGLGPGNIPLTGKRRQFATPQQQTFGIPGPGTPFGLPTQFIREGKKGQQIEFAPLRNITAETASANAVLQERNAFDLAQQRAALNTEIAVARIRGLDEIATRLEAQLSIEDQITKATGAKLDFLLEHKQELVNIEVQNRNILVIEKERTSLLNISRALDNNIEILALRAAGLDHEAELLRNITALKQQHKNLDEGEIVALAEKQVLFSENTEIVRERLAVEDMISDITGNIEVLQLQLAGENNLADILRTQLDLRKRFPELTAAQLAELEKVLATERKLTAELKAQEKAAKDAIAAEKKAAKEAERAAKKAAKDAEKAVKDQRRKEAAEAKARQRAAEERAAVRQAAAEAAARRAEERAAERKKQGEALADTAESESRLKALREQGIIGAVPLELLRIPSELFFRGLEQGLFTPESIGAAAGAGGRLNDIPFAALQQVLSGLPLFTAESAQAAARFSTQLGVNRGAFTGAQALDPMFRQQFMVPNETGVPTGFNFSAGLGIPQRPGAMPIQAPRIGGRGFDFGGVTTGNLANAALFVEQMAEFNKMATSFNQFATSFGAGGQGLQTVSATSGIFNPLNAFMPSPTNIFRGATGTDRLFTRPSLLSVAETGPERVTARPTASGGGRGGDGVVLQISGPVIFDDITMQGFIREISREINRNSQRGII